MKKISIAALICVMGAVIYFVLFVPKRFKVESVSPSGEVQVRGLRFQAQDAHALDGTLRLYINDDPQQTTIRWSNRLDISWVALDSHESFEINEDGSVLMRWRINEDKATCEYGQEYLTGDP
ncbi:hypothetical protein NT6N_24510 [Oceaniferula spumae]|uniref:Uncharacterized protein n=1 Tax=Oceaniferula spumae TaxID=2979115 RepID=A0AAT9FNC1_9BACT